MVGIEDSWCSHWLNLPSFGVHLLPRPVSFHQPGTWHLEQECREIPWDWDIPTVLLLGVGLSQAAESWVWALWDLLRSTQFHLVSPELLPIKNRSFSACHHKRQTRGTSAGAQGKRFIQVLHNLGEWWTPISKTISPSCLSPPFFRDREARAFFPLTFGILRALSIHLFLKILFIYLFLERGEGRRKERERNINVWLPLTHPQQGTCSTTQASALTGNWTSNLLVHRPALNPLSHTIQGSSF